MNNIIIIVITGEVVTLKKDIDFRKKTGILSKAITLKLSGKIQNLF